MKLTSGILSWFCSCYPASNVLQAQITIFQEISRKKVSFKGNSRLEIHGTSKEYLLLPNLTWQKQQFTSLLYFGFFPLSVCKDTRSSLQTVNVCILTHEERVYIFLPFRLQINTHWIITINKWTQKPTANSLYFWKHSTMDTNMICDVFSRIHIPNHYFLES